MTDLVEFLRVRLDDDEAYARNAFGDHNDAGPDWHEPSSGLLDVGDGDHIITNDSAVSRFVERFDPARALAEVEAKRKLMGAHARPHECIALTGSGDRSVADGQPWELWELEHTEDHGPCFVLRCLALPYAPHPEYDESWRP